MVDPVSPNAISSLLRAQTAGTAAGIVALKTNQQAQQAIINQLQQGLDKGKALMSQSSPPPAPATTLPRGSLVDVYA